MRFRNTRVGDAVEIGRVWYRITKIYPNFVMAEGIETGVSTTFTFGDLVMIGKESGAM